VHDGILQDIVHPIEIVGKRTRVRVDGSKLLKIFLDPKEQGAAESKLRSYAAVYKKLTNKNVEFSFPIKN
jgi:small subunit ribosomal protein S7e